MAVPLAEVGLGDCDAPHSVPALSLSLPPQLLLLPLLLSSIMSNAPKTYKAAVITKANAPFEIHDVRLIHRSRLLLPPRRSNSGRHTLTGVPATQIEYKKPQKGEIVVRGAAAGPSPLARPAFLTSFSCTQSSLRASATPYVSTLLSRRLGGSCGLHPVSAALAA